MYNSTAYSVSLMENVIIIHRDPKAQYVVHEKCRPHLYLEVINQITFLDLVFICWQVHLTPLLEKSFI